MRITGQFTHLSSAQKPPWRQADIGNAFQQKDLQLPGVLPDQIPAVLGNRSGGKGAEPAVPAALCGQIQQSSFQNGLCDTPETAEGTGLALRWRLPDDKGGLLSSCQSAPISAGYPSPGTAVPCGLLVQNAECPGWCAALRAGGPMTSNLLVCQFQTAQAFTKIPAQGAPRDTKLL